MLRHGLLRYILYTLYIRPATWGGVGGGGVGCNDMHCHAHIFDATQLHLRTCSMLRNYTCAHVRCMPRNYTCAHVRCYAITLAHMFDATQLHLARIWCYAIALAHMLDATQLHLRTCSMHATQLHLRTCSMLRNYTCAHVRCYAITLSTYLMLRNCTCAHARCYAITLAHMLDATQLHLRTSPRSCPKHISVAYNPMSSLWDLISITGICQLLPHHLCHHHHQHHQNFHRVITSTVIRSLTTTLLPHS